MASSRSHGVRRSERRRPGAGRTHRSARDRLRSSLAALGAPRTVPIPELSPSLPSWGTSLCRSRSQPPWRSPGCRCRSALPGCSPVRPRPCRYSPAPGPTGGFGRCLLCRAGSGDQHPTNCTRQDIPARCDPTARRDPRSPSVHLLPPDTGRVRVPHPRAAPRGFLAWAGPWKAWGDTGHGVSLGLCPQEGEKKALSIRGGVQDMRGSRTQWGAWDWLCEAQLRVSLGFAVLLLALVFPCQSSSRRPPQPRSVPAFLLDNPGQFGMEAASRGPTALCEPDHGCLGSEEAARVQALLTL